MDQQIEDIIKELKVKFESLRAIETGTIRSFEEKTRSTLYISEALGDWGHLYSIDNNKEHIMRSKMVCSERYNISWVEKDSIEYIKETKDKFHFAYLDSKNDAAHIFKEFKAIIPKMIEGGIILIDNAGIKSKDPKAQKGWDIYKFFIKENIGYKDETWYTLLKLDHGNRLRIRLYKEVLDLIKKKL